VFAEIYGAVAGNMALQLKTTGGVYVGGGIAPNILSLMKDRFFMENFLDKGRFQDWLERIPVRLILNEKASLLGAAHYALDKKFVRL
jgi:glucokinase